MKTNKRRTGCMLVAALCGLFFLFHSALASQREDAESHDGHAAMQKAHDTSSPDAPHDHTKAGRDEKEATHVHPIPASQAAEQSAGVGVDEQLGQIIPLQARFLDENGKAARLGDRVDKPTLLLPVFYHCPMACDMMMASLATALKEVTLEAGAEYHVLSLSFDHEDTPETAKGSKANYMRILGADFPETAWHFLTGEQAAIKTVTDAAGYQFKQTGRHNFIHPNVLIVLAHDGKIIRYLYGPNFLPFDVSMALVEATQGTPSVSIKKLLTFCFDYDPKGKTYVFKTFRILGGVIFFSLIMFYFLVLRKGKKSRRGSDAAKGENHGQ